ncbi:4-hydroxythreonine-4-phosphate dehydrogenase PdxA [Candidatus Pelagibacter sp.]|nr:4-hydroxythreonine-4-phosphate dehydrogenase PdxA [Candidatus Pelagibacter sp.]
MKFSPILVVAGEPNSVFLEIFFKTIKYKKFKSPIILIASKKLLKLQMIKLKFKIKIRDLNIDKLNYSKLDNKYINLIDVSYNSNKPFEKISRKSNQYIKESFEVAFKLLKKGVSKKIINGPISKKSFLNKKFLGITEYLSDSFAIKKKAMLIFNAELSVCPITTHLPLKKVPNKINKKNISEKIFLLNNFYKRYLKKTPRIGVLGLNPHCESILNFNEDEKIIKPLVKYLNNKNFNITGPISADTAFLKKNREKFDVIVGMYHDQVLTPIKTLFEYDAINITLGLPFLRISPDHGPNEKMMGKNISNPLSLIKAISFLDKN